MNNCYFVSESVLIALLTVSVTIKLTGKVRRTVVIESLIGFDVLPAAESQPYHCIV